MKKRFLSLVITLCLIISGFAPAVLAESIFPDVLSPDHDWASKQIEDMTSLGILKGYEDGTFKPDKSISKIEALLLFSRVSGFSNKENEKIAEFAYNKYRNVLDDIELGIYEDYKYELAFLLYKDILTDEELAEYLADGVYSEEFPRSDAAILLSNLMDAEIKNVKAEDLDFADADEIPSGALGYIAFAVEEGLMNGVQKDDGTIVFDAEAPLSRAQVCVLLYRIIEKFDMSVESGIISKVKADDNVIDFVNSSEKAKSYIIPENAKIKIDGNVSSLDKVLDGSAVVVTRHGKDIYSLDVINPESNITVKGTVDSVVSSKTYKKISVKLDSGEIQTYYPSGEFKVSTDGVADEFSSIKTNDFVVIKLLGSAIISIDRQTAEATVQGVLSDIILSDPVELTVITTDETTEKENEATYTVSENVSVRRDGSRVSMSDILVGDKVVLTVSRGEVTKISATSSKGSVTGTITAITIAAQSKLTLSVNSIETTYPVSMDAEYIVADKKASIYDLRLGNLVTLSLSSSTVTKVEQAVASSVTTKSGVIDSTSVSYGYINLLVAGLSGTVEEQIFASKSVSSINAKILNGETGKEITFKELKKGDYIIATGAYSNGAFVAKTIIVTPMAN